MANPKDVLFGPVVDEQRDYWQRNKRDAILIDNHFNARAHGQKLDTRSNAYAIPRSAKVALKETAIGGLPVWDNAAMVWDERYAQAQNKLAQTYPATNQTYNNDREVDAGGILQQRLLAQAAMPSSPMHGAMPGNAMVNGLQSNQQVSRTCLLAEGHTFYQTLQIQGFGATQPLAKTGGKIQGVQGRQFQIDGTITAYVVDGLQTIDLSKMEPSRLKPLVRVSAPLLGTLLVPQEAIMEANMGGAPRQLLIDSSNPRQQQAQRIQQMPQRPVVNPQSVDLQAQSRALLARRGLLRG